MKLSINWLENFLSLDGLTPEEVAEKLTMSSFEVEEIQKIGPRLQGPIVVGKILDIQKHPNADRLSVTKVTTDGASQLQIVCGAKNIKIGQLVPVSLPGAVVINRQDGSSLAIKKSKIRDIESFGMLCSPSELGMALDDLEDGILILKDDANLGDNVIDYLLLRQDTILEVASRSNRGDALSVYGLCKEISALTKRKTNEIFFKPPKSTELVSKNIVSKIENEQDTFLFYTVVVENIKVSDSPLWLKRLLESVGIRAINNIVDITNYINFSFGQPMHAYDLAKLKGNTLMSRFAKDHEQILTLDGKLRKLNSGVLVIADEGGPQAISGIMGGKDSEVTANTNSIVLEAAVFNPMKVRRGSRSIGLTSEASKRFERGVDKSFTQKALLKSIELIEQLAGTDNTLIGPINQAGNPSTREIVLNLTTYEVKRVLGIDLSVKDISELLESIEFKTKIISENKLEIFVPASRIGDISRSIDIVEEIARFYGYNNIPELPPSRTIAAGKLSDGLEKIKGHFLSSGFSEVYLSSLVGEQILGNKEFLIDESSQVSMINPLSQEHSVLRQYLLPGLLDALRLNQNYKNSIIKLFEIGKAYYFNNLKIPTEKETCVTEELKLAGVLAGYDENWFTNQGLLQNSVNQLFFTMKGILESLFERSDVNYCFTPSNQPFLHPNLALKISLNNKDIGNFGCLHPQIEKRLGIVGPILVCEINLEGILKGFEQGKVFKKISSQPIVIRDITVDLSRERQSGDLITEIDKIKSKFIINVSLVSVFELDEETKSLTFRLKMQDFEQTLTSTQVENEIDKIKKHLTTCFQAKFRV